MYKIKFESFARVIVAPLTLILASAFAVSAQYNGSIKNPPKQSWMKVENGMILSFQRFADRNGPQAQVAIYDSHGEPVTSLNVLNLVPEARSVGVDDVSIRPGQAIAVTAVYDKGPGVRPSNLLLLYDAKGALLNAVNLEPSRAIMYLALDENLNVWALTEGADDKNPADVPMVEEIDQAGQVIKQMLPRSEFPMHAEYTQENPRIGSVSAGYGGGVFWFWLPGSTELVTVQTKDGTVARMNTDLPRPRSGGQIIPLFIAREQSGSIIAEVRQEAPSSKARLAYFTWSPSTRSWSEFSPGVCANHRLAGLIGNDEVFVQHGNAAAADVCVYDRGSTQASRL